MQTLTTDQKQSMLEVALRSPEGRQNLASSMLAPLRRRVDYSAPLAMFVDGSSLVDHPPWSTPALESDFDEISWFRPLEDESVLRMMERTHLHLGNTAGAWVDGEVVQMMNAVATPLPTAELSRENFEEAILRTSSSEDQFGRVLLNARGYADLRKKAWFSEHGDPVGSSNLLTGMIYKYKNHYITTSRLCEGGDPFPVLFSGPTGKVGVVKHDISLSWVEEHVDMPKGAAGGIRMTVRLLAGLASDAELFIRRFKSPV